MTRQHPVRRVRTAAMVLLLAAAPATRASAQPPASAPVQIVGIERDAVRYGPGDELRLSMCNLPETIAAGSFDATRLVLYLDGRPLGDVTAHPFVPGQRDLVFTLVRDDGNRAAWNRLVNRTRSDTGDVSVGIVDASGREIPWAPAPSPAAARPGAARTNPPDSTANKSAAPACVTPPGTRRGIGLRGIDATRMLFAVVCFVLAIGGFVALLAMRRGVAEPPNPFSAARPVAPPADADPALAPAAGAAQSASAPQSVSLSKTQAALWFFVVLGCFLVIWVLTGDFRGIITPQSLVLMAVSAGTALGASAVRTAQAQSATRELEAVAPAVARMQQQRDVRELVEADPSTAASFAMLTLREEQATSKLGKPADQGMLADLVGDATGVSIARLQLVVWTLVLAGIFVWTAWRDLAFPTFDDSLLLLMGISNGGYLGLRTTERQPLT